MTFQFSLIDLVVAVSTIAIAWGYAIWFREVMFDPLLPLWGQIAIISFAGLIAVAWSNIAVSLTRRRAWIRLNMILFYVTIAAVGILLRITE